MFAIMYTLFLFFHYCVGLRFSTLLYDFHKIWRC